LVVGLEGILNSPLFDGILIVVLFGGFTGLFEAFPLNVAAGILIVVFEEGAYTLPSFGDFIVVLLPVLPSEVLPIKLGCFMVVLPLELFDVLLGP
jgi:hypothetical protein